MIAIDLAVLLFLRSEGQANCECCFFHGCYTPHMHDGCMLLNLYPFSLSLSLSSFLKKKFKKILTKTFTTKHLSFFVWGSPHISLYHFCYRYKKPSKTNKTPKGARKLLQGWPNPPSSSGEESFFLSVTFVFYFFYKVSNLCDMEIFYRLL
jgi:hypothetical protein